MDVKHQTLLINKSLEQAQTARSESLRDLFLAQAGRLESELNTYTKENPGCSDAKPADTSRKPKKGKQRRSSRSVSAPTRTS